MQQPASDFMIKVALDHAPDDGKVQYIAASPPDHRSSFSGSGLPFANPKQAFDGTPNKGVVTVSEDDPASVVIPLRYPNAFYVGLGTVYVPPMLYLSYKHNGTRVEESMEVSQGVPFRTLTYPASRRDASFYKVQEQAVRSQEAILRASEYPDRNVMPPNFWGEKPPC